MEDTRFEILQLKDEYDDRRFRGLAELDQATLPIRDEQYSHVYQSTCPPNTSLDSIFARFNIDRPEDFTGWSLSVGDVILMHSEDGDHAFFVDSFGFSEIEHFFEPLVQAQTQEPQAQDDTMRVTVRSASRDEQEFAYTPGGFDGDASGCLGHLRVDMGSDGKEFYTDWTPHMLKDMPDGFDVYLNTLISELRTNRAFDGMLTDRGTLSSFCYHHPESRILGEDNKYSFRVDAREYAMILRLTPNRGEYSAYAYCYQRDMLDRLLNIRREEQAKAHPPVYRHTSAYARSSGEIEAWRASHQENVACREAIDQAIRDHFNGYHLDELAITTVMERFGSERVAFVLANTILMKEHDGRFSRDNRAWAQAEQIPIDRSELGIVRNDEYVSRSHPAVLDGYISTARQAMETPAVEKIVTINLRGRNRQRQEQRDTRSDKPSVRSQLKEKQTQTKAKAPDKKQPVKAPKRESL